MDSSRFEEYAVRQRVTALTAVALLTLVGCTDGSADSADASSTGANSAGASETNPPSSAEASTSAAPTSSDAPLSCAQQTAADLAPKEKIAQLVLVAMTPDSVDAAAAQISEGNASGVFLLGGWPSIETTAAASAQIHELSGDVDTWVAIDQEGGEVQQLRGGTVANIPAAVEQAAMDPVDLQTQAETWAASLVEAGIDINLAPVADVVPADIGAANAPIGQFGRQYGTTPDAVTPPMIAFMKGMQDGGILPTVKHFPGIGRIQGNTDVTTDGISDPTTTPDDPALAPFEAAIADGAPIIMVSTAIYPSIDPDNNAAFSAPIITDLLRDDLGFDGVVMSDDLGAAASVSDVPVGQRLTRFVDAGGDVVLTADPNQAVEMNSDALAKYDNDPQFAEKVDAAALRILTLKDEQGSLACSG
ncbi:glycoside hydrolase family 3 N-terminal domain-containing protein [Cumulibacter soli]|uniref:glycoside hydrolase family 3 N-terminal domain-containing protein n=1 Tax=Cumulibacter soli TaxID=2546344 RepID=UPI00106893B3|nr:glycoside hydrolase family 3 N-terminal domain-containing protein [Cumulibacter soli]